MGKELASEVNAPPESFCGRPQFSLRHVRWPLTGQSNGSHGNGKATWRHTKAPGEVADSSGSRHDTKPCYDSPLTPASRNQCVSRDPIGDKRACVSRGLVSNICKFAPAMERESESQKRGEFR